MNDDDELRRLIQDAEPAHVPENPDALVDSLVARIEAAAAAGETAAATSAAEPPVPAAPARPWWAGWRGIAAGAGAVALGVVIALLLTSLAAGDGATPVSASPTPTPTVAVSPSSSATASATPWASPTPSATPSPSPTASPEPTETEDPEPPPAPEPPADTEDPEPPPAPEPPPDTTAPTIRVTSAIDDIWETHDVCGPNTLRITAEIGDDTGVAAAEIVYKAGNAPLTAQTMTRGSGTTYHVALGPIPAGSVAQDLQPTLVSVELWATDAAGNRAISTFSVPVRSAWACAPG